MRLAVIPGDGIGPEVIAEALKVLNEVVPDVEVTKYDLGATRWHATGELLPESVLHRRKSPYPSTQDPVYERSLRRSLRELLEDPDAPVAPLINRERVREMLATPLEVSGFGPGRRAAELLLGLDLWLRRYPVHLPIHA